MNIFPRVIPTLLLSKRSFVKGVHFKNHSYVGDPLNIIKLFNDKEANELLILDIVATKERSAPDFDYLKKLSSQAFMPMSYGGGIKSLEDAMRIVDLGFEKVVMNSSFYTDPSLVKDISSSLGSSSTVVSIDIKKDLFRKKRAFRNSGKEKCKLNILEYALMAQDYGAGEIILCSIDHEGKYMGYDYEIIENISSSLEIPVVASGGASSLNDFNLAMRSGASAVSAGNLFIYTGKHKAVLVSYPSHEQIKELFA